MDYNFQYDIPPVWFFIPIFFSLVIAVFYVFCMWKLFTKAGKPGWAALIPIYNTLVHLEILGRVWFWLLLMFIPGVNLVIFVVMMLDLAKVFGKDTSFGCLLILFPFVMIPILALGDAKYLGPIAAQPPSATPQPPAPTSQSPAPKA
jgi:hypothetical protein